MTTKEEWGAQFYREFCAIYTGHEAFIERIQNDAFAAGRDKGLVEAIETHMAHPPSEHYECQQALKALRTVIKQSTEQEDGK